MADTASSETASFFSAQIPDETPVSTPANGESAAPAADLPKVDTDVMALLAKPFVSTSDQDDQEEAVTDAITEVIIRLLVEYFPSTMNRQTKNGIIMIVREVLSWACPEGHSCRCCHIRLGCLQLSGFSFSYSCICVHCFWPRLSGLTFLNLTFLMCSTVVEHSRDTACTKIDSCFRELEYSNSSDLRSRSDHTSTIRR